MCRVCGRQRSECSDPERPWFPQREVCYASMEREAANARWARLHEDRPWHDGTFKNWAAKPSDSHPYHRDHGVTIGVHEVDIRPDDQFLTVESSPRVQSPSQADPNEA